MSDYSDSTDPYGGWLHPNVYHLTQQQEEGYYGHPTSQPSQIYAPQEDTSGAVVMKREPRCYKTDNQDEEWMVYYDNKSQQEYYYEKKSGKTQWEPPATEGKKKKDAASVSTDTTEAVSDVMSEYSERDVAAATEPTEPRTPVIYNPEQCTMNASPPYWAHLVQATQAMGLTSPPEGHGLTTPGIAMPMSPPYGYYCYEQVSNGAYEHPSPATQFMMSPRASFSPYQSSGYGVSPGGHRRRELAPRRLSFVSSDRSSPSSSSSDRNSAASTPVPSKIAEDRCCNSPSTVQTETETMNESESSMGPYAKIVEVRGSPSTIQTANELESLTDSHQT
jgi:hypothetical protein